MLHYYCLSFQVFTTLIYSTKAFFWFLDRAVGLAQNLAVTYHLNLQGNNCFAIHLEQFSQLTDGRSTFFRNVGTINRYTVQKLKI